MRCRSIQRLWLYTFDAGVHVVTMPAIPGRVVLIFPIKCSGIDTAGRMPVCREKILSAEGLQRSKNDYYAKQKEWKTVMNTTVIFQTHYFEDYKLKGCKRLGISRRRRYPL